MRENRAFWIFIAFLPTVILQISCYGDSPRNFAVKISSTSLYGRYLQYYPGHLRDRQQRARLTISADCSEGRRLYWVQNKAFRCEVDRLGESVLDVDLSQTLREMPSTKGWIVAIKSSETTLFRQHPCYCTSRFKRITLTSEKSDSLYKIVFISASHVK